MLRRRRAPRHRDPPTRAARDGVIPGALHVPRTVLEWRVDPSSPWRNAARRRVSRTVIVALRPRLLLEPRSRDARRARRSATSATSSAASKRGSRPGCRPRQRRTTTPIVSRELACRTSEEPVARAATRRARRASATASSISRSSTSSGVSAGRWYSSYGKCSIVTAGTPASANQCESTPPVAGPVTSSYRSSSPSDARRLDAAAEQRVGRGEDLQLLAVRDAVEIDDARDLVELAAELRLVDVEARAGRA